MLKTLISVLILILDRQMYTTLYSCDTQVRFLPFKFWFSIYLSSF